MCLSRFTACWLWFIEARERVTRSLQVLLPTCWAELERQGDLIAKDSARLLFYELWLPAGVLKLRLPPVQMA